MAGTIACCLGTTSCSASGATACGGAMTGRKLRAEPLVRSQEGKACVQGGRWWTKIQLKLWVLDIYRWRTEVQLLLRVWTCVSYRLWTKVQMLLRVWTWASYRLWTKVQLLLEVGSWTGDSLWIKVQLLLKVWTRASYRGSSCVGRVTVSEADSWRWLRD